MGGLIVAVWTDHVESSRLLTGEEERSDAIEYCEGSVMLLDGLPKVCPSPIRSRTPRTSAWGVVSDPRPVSQYGNGEPFPYPSGVRAIEDIGVRGLP